MDTGGGEEQKTISVISACLNEESRIGRLMDSLDSQTDKNFSWVVADGGSTDGTVQKIKQFESRFPHLLLDSEPDGGIYSGLNRALRMSKADYYLVMGADDFLHPTAIENFRRVISQVETDLVVAPVLVNGRRVGSKWPHLLWLHGASALVPAHSVGTLINRKVHDKHGLYDESFRIYADGYIMLKLLRSECSISRINVPSGEFSMKGVSNSSQFVSFSEHFRAQVLTGSNYALQLFLFCLRLLKWRKTITASWLSSTDARAENALPNQIERP